MTNATEIKYICYVNDIDLLTEDKVRFDEIVEKFIKTETFPNKLSEDEGLLNNYAVNIGYVRYENYLPEGYSTELMNLIQEAHEGKGDKPLTEEEEKTLQKKIKDLDIKYGVKVDTNKKDNK